MKQLFLATVSALALSGTTYAADLQFKAPPRAALSVADWSGTYLGIEGGFVRHEGSFTDLDCFLTCGATSNHSEFGGTVGGVLGHNWQSGSFVYGL